MPSVSTGQERVIADVEVPVAEIVLVACSSLKSLTRRPACELYISERFQKARVVAQRIGDRWFILSGKHGLLSPEVVVQPYDSELSHLPESELQLWADSVFRSLRDSTRPHDRVTILASAEYASGLSEILMENGYCVRLPLRFRDRAGTLRWLDTVLGATERSVHLDRFYELLQQLERKAPGQPIGMHARATPIPPRGVYFFSEHAENRLTDSTRKRVVRVGTHAVSRGSKSTLWTRVRTHLGTQEGGGSHRSSIMRLHVGSAILARADGKLHVPSWGRGQTASREIRTAEQVLENEVSRYIADMFALWVAVGDESSPLSDRAYIEQNAIGLLAGQSGPVDVADSRWLGSYCPHEAVRRSSLWNVDYVNGFYEPEFLDILKRYVAATLGDLEMPSHSLAPSNWHSLRPGKGNREQLSLFATE